MKYQRRPLHHRLGAALLATFVLPTGCVLENAAAQSTSLTVLERPPLSGASVHYTSNRRPLRPTPAIALPAGSVTARGWLLECLRRQRAGITGHLHEISAWLQKEDNAWLAPDGQGRWGWEEVPYWLKGYGDLAYLLEDPEMIAETMVWLEGALASQREDGNFGPIRTFQDDGSQDFWANMVMLFCLQAHYERTQDARVLELMRRYFRFQLQVPDARFLTHYWQRMRGGDNLWSVYWLYNRTGEAWLLELANKLHRNTADWGQATGLPNWHNVNIAQGFREPATYYQQTKDRADLDATYRAFHTVRGLYGQVPGGMFGSDENCRSGHNDPRQAIETCGIAEQMASNQMLFSVTGDPFWADHCEEVAFNSWPAAFTQDYRALRYLFSPNHVVSDAENHAPGVQNAGPFLVMNPLSHRCCQHNHSHGWTSFTKSLWTATLDGGLCAAMYGPSCVSAVVGADEGQQVKLSTDTRYPFDDSVEFSLELAETTLFPLYLRIPGWCQGARVYVNGGEVTGEQEVAPGTFVRLERSWNDGDTVALSLPMEIETQRWRHNHGAASVRRGPLVFSLEIEQRYEKRDPTQVAVHDALWLDSVDTEKWPAQEIFPTSDWNFGLLLPQQGTEGVLKLEERPWPADDFPFSLEGTPVRIRASGRRIPAWRTDRFGLAAELQDSPVASTEPVTELTLVPMGSALLRISAFPVIADNGKGNQWQEPNIPRTLYRVRASHTHQGDTARAVADAVLPKSSGDQSIERHTFWPRVGTKEWLEARFDGPRTLSSVEVYWFDDRDSSGGCRVPESWQLFALVEGEWKPLAGEAVHGVARDQFNRVDFSQITTDALRIELKLHKDASAGVLEWRIDSERD